MSAPTPRTDAAWSASFEGKQLSAGQTARALRDCSQQLERELTALTAERDHWQEIAKAASAEREHNANVAQAIAAERDQLRAEVKRLTKQIKDDNRSYGCELRDPNGTIWEQATKDHARAERAEADLAAAKERLRSEAMDDYASIKNLQRELATERARLNHVLRNDWHFRDRKEIDAAMKEGAK